MPYTPSGDKEKWQDYAETVELVKEKSIEGKEIREKLQLAESNIENLDSEVQKVKSKISELRSELQRNVDLLQSHEKEYKQATSAKDKATQLESNILDEFESLKTKRDQSRSTYLDSIPNRILVDSVEFGDLNNSPHPENLELYCLGDVHGWAPGLINFLLHHEISDVIINGKKISEVGGCENVFPAPKDVTIKGMQTENLFYDKSPFFNSLDEMNRGFIRDVSVEINSKFSKSGMFIQVGDLNDRGDFSELCFDIIRQLTLGAPGRCFSLIGNHEEMLLTGNFANWLTNEQKSGMYESEESPGSIRLLNSSDDLQSEIFHSYSAHYAQMLLAQEFSLRSILTNESLDRYRSITQPALDLANIDDEKLENLCKSRSWEDIEKCLDWFELLRSKSGHGLSVPGCFNVFSIGHFSSLHASISSIGEFINDSTFGNFVDGFETKNGAILRIHNYRMPQESKKSLDYNRLWARDHKTWGSGNPSKEMRESVTSFTNQMPFISMIVQGHEVLGKKLKIGQSIVELQGSNKVNLFNLDVGMTPHYLPHDLDNRYSMSRLPDGLKSDTIGSKPLVWGPEISHEKGIKIIHGVQGNKHLGGSISDSWGLIVNQRNNTIGKFRYTSESKYQLSIESDDIFIQKPQKGGSLFGSYEPVKEFEFPSNTPIMLMKRVTTSWLLFGKKYKYERYSGLEFGQCSVSAIEEDMGKIARSFEEEEERERKEREERERKEREERERKEREERERKEREERERQESESQKVEADTSLKESDKSENPFSGKIRNRPVIIDAANICRSTPDNQADGLRLSKAIKYFIERNHDVHVVCISRYFSNIETKDEWFPETDFVRRNTLNAARNITFHHIPSGLDDDLSLLKIAKKHDAFVLSQDRFKQEIYTGKGFANYRFKTGRLRLEPITSSGLKEFELTAESLDTLRNG